MDRELDAVEKKAVDLIMKDLEKCFEEEDYGTIFVETEKIFKEKVQIIRKLSPLGRGIIIGSLIDKVDKLNDSKYLVIRVYGWLDRLIFGVSIGPVTFSDEIMIKYKNAMENKFTPSFYQYIDRYFNEVRVRKASSAQLKRKLGHAAWAKFKSESRVKEWL